MKTIKIIALLMIMFFLGSCKKDQNDVETPIPPNEQELITTVTLHFTEVGNTSNYFMASFKDVDGAGGNDATIDTIKLDTNSSYNVSVELLDESTSSTKIITTEVKEEDAEHLFCYESSTTNINVTITDSDGTFPLGIDSDWETTDEVNSTIKLTLKHQPDGVKDGTCSPGETDVEVSFPLVIQ